MTDSDDDYPFRVGTAAGSLFNRTDATGTEYITVNVTAHPVPLPVLGRFLGLSPFSLTRSVKYRWERAGGAA